VAQTVQFTAQREVALIDCAAQPLTAGSVRVRTWYSGISAGTELTAYRGSNPYLSRTWDSERRLFRDGPPTFAYPLIGWGYSEVGEVVEIADDVTGFEIGQVVYGIWGHRSDAVLRADVLAGATLEPGQDPVVGAFARVGAIALNAVLASDARLGERLVVFGQGVIGLLATRLAVVSGVYVIAVDLHPERLESARALGASQTVVASVDGGAGDAVRALSRDVGVDAAIELSGSYAALHEAVRSVAVDGTVVAAGFYQAGADQLLLGEEFHHNRVRIVSSQISGTPLSLGPRWYPKRLVAVFMRLVAAGKVDVRQLVSDIVAAEDVGTAFERLDAGAPETLQILLRFDAAPSR